MEVEDDFVLASEVLRGLPGRGVVPPLYEVVQAVFVMAIE
jgi:hypothetical protein